MAGDTYYTISEVSRLAGRCPETIRRWERLGLVRAAKRQPLTGARLVSEEEVAAIKALVEPRPAVKE